MPKLAETTKKIVREFIGKLLLFLLICASGLSVGIVMEKGGFWISAGLCGIMAILIILERKDIVGKKPGNLMIFVFAFALIATAAFFI